MRSRHHERIIAAARRAQQRWAVGSLQALSEAMARPNPLEPMAEHLGQYAALVQLQLGLNLFDSQLRAALHLAEGRFVSLPTGEGKTVVLPFVAWLMSHKRVATHVVTANDYLAQRDAISMADLYKAMGLTVAVAVSGQPEQVRAQVYQHDVVYSTAQVLALDHLHDGAVRQPQQMLRQRTLRKTCALVDEADQVLLDEATTPVILSVPNEVAPATYQQLLAVARGLTLAGPDGVGDFQLDLEHRQPVFTESGYDKVSELLRTCGLLTPLDEDWGPRHQELLLYSASALAALYLLRRDEHYLVDRDTIVLLDPVTGRAMPGRRWDAGLHQLLEVKEDLAASHEQTTVGRITLQNYFLHYGHLVGVSGSLAAAADELRELYLAKVEDVAPHRQCIRQDHRLQTFATQQAKLQEVLRQAKVCQQSGRPLLIGVRTVQQCQEVAGLLADAGLKAAMLSAHDHAHEAEILAAAGDIGAITVVTPMAGRGVDIKLGGNVDLDLLRHLRAQIKQGREVQVTPELRAQFELQQQLRRESVLQAGGLLVIAMEMMDSARADDQLRGRAGRQGDPGESRIFCGPEDTLLLSSGKGYELQRVCAVLNVDPGSADFDKLLAQYVCAAQSQAQGQQVSARLALSRYESIFEFHQERFQEIRREVMQASDGGLWFVFEQLDMLVHRLLDEWFEQLGEKQQRVPQVLEQQMGLQLDWPQLVAWAEDQGHPRAQLAERLKRQMHEQLLERLAAAAPGQDDSPQVLRWSVLTVLDRLWITHLEQLTALRTGIHLRAHAKMDPQIVFNREAYQFFERMVEQIPLQLAGALLRPA